MASWHWLTQARYSWSFVGRVTLKTAGLFVLFNLLYALLNPSLAGISVYGRLVPYRERLPYADRPERAYNLSLNDLEVMLASHAIQAPKATDEYRVVLIGDSATWGVLLRPQESYSGVLNRLQVQAEGRRIVAYNLAYPQQSLSKDVLFLQEALRYAPDAIVWLTTLEAFSPDAQYDPLIVRHNPQRLRQALGEALVERYDTLPNAPRLTQFSPWDATLIGERRALADALRLQIYGLAWANTGIDQDYPSQYPLRSNDFDPIDLGGDLRTWRGQDALPLRLAWEVLDAGYALAERANVPLLLVNEPIFIADGLNSEQRYNFWYPRWAYDAYRQALAEWAQQRSVEWLDLWNAVAPEAFTDSPVHLNPAGAQQVAEALAQALQR